MNTPRKRLPATYRILSVSVPGGASGTGNRYEKVCAGQRYHATIVTLEWDGTFVDVTDIGDCDCTERKMIPQLRKALAKYEKDRS